MMMLPHTCTAPNPVPIVGHFWWAQTGHSCQAPKKKGCVIKEMPHSTRQEVPTRQDPRDALMLGRTIKTTGITVLRAEPSRGKDWWVCRCPCGREFIAHGWGV